MKEIGKCVEKVRSRDGWAWFPCSVKAKVVRDGQPYCGRHDPVKVVERRAAREVKYKVAVEADRAKRVAEKERERRAGCFDGMLEALEELVSASDQVVTGSHGHAFLPGQFARFIKASGEAKEVVFKAKRGS